MKIKCIIVDDEALAREGLEQYVNQIEFLDLKGVCKNALQALNLLEHENIDLIFLDIEMPKLTGLEFLKTLDPHPHVIFTTAYSHYALEGYQFNVIDYLVKPIPFNRFLQAANKAKKIILNARSSAPKEEYLFVKTGKDLVKIQVNEILYIEGMQNYISLYTSKEKILALVPMKNVFELLSTDDFLQVHKSYIVAKAKVEAIVGNQILIGKSKIPISTRMRKEVVDILTKDRLLKK